MTIGKQEPPKTRLDYLRDQFDPSSGPFLDPAGIAELDNSGIQFNETLCPCPNDPSQLCPCDSIFMLYDPKMDGDVTFANGFSNIPVIITPTTVNGLDRYIVPFDQFSDGNEMYHVKIHKNGKSISLKSPGV